ncbi:MAG: DUF5597 domain-containing protein [Bacteroidaceae bacterium]|nr:DUF5597 domain-containing protein [Bacteroidaceae bacterium]
MKRLFSCVLCFFALSALAQIPSLQKVGSSTCLIVDGKPFVMYCGELHNSTASSLSYMQEHRVWDKLKEMRLNSVIATVSWELVEPVEGQYDFTLVDAMMAEARKRDMKIAFLWFGAFKNPMMTYAPSWVKSNPKKYPHAVDDKGQEMEHISVYGTEILKADTKAYKAFLQHLKDTDKDHTVVMIQLQNEPGLRGTPRDFSADANKAWKAQVPQQIVDYLKANKGQLQPDLERIWAKYGNKTTGNWEELFGKSEVNNQAENPIRNFTEHVFTAYGYANYLEQMAKAGKEVYPLPVFINASVFGMNTRGNSLGNGCSIPEFFDIYRASAPHIDILTPNSYMQQLDWLGKAFSWKGNPILIPESTLVGARGLYIIGEYDAIAFSPFGIDYEDSELNPNLEKQHRLLAESYDQMQQMGSLITDNLGSDKMRGIYLYSGRETDEVEMGDYVLTFGPRKSFDIGALMAPAGGGFQVEDQQQIEQGGALIVQTAADEFYVVGYGFNADVKLKDGVKSKFCGYDSIWEGRFENGKFIPGRLLNGDERNVFASYDKVNALKVKMFHY